MPHPEDYNYTSKLEECTIREERVQCCYRILAPDGSIIGEVPNSLTEENFTTLYRWMLFQRQLDKKMFSLHRRGELGTVETGHGQEGSIVGSAYALKNEDWMFPSGRAHAAPIMHGMSLSNLFLYWRGIEDGNRRADSHVFPYIVSLGSKIPVSVGAGLALKLKKEPGIIAVYFGEGSTSTGAFHEALNFAGTFNLPMVFICQNNQYAISTPTDLQTGAGSFAKKAAAYGMGGFRVDGNDIFAAFEAVEQSREAAVGGQPSLIELVNYRLDPHSTNDDPSLYRDSDEEEAWEKHSPLNRLELYLKNNGHWKGIDNEKLTKENSDLIESGIEIANDFQKRQVEDLFKYVYETPTNELVRQKSYLNRLVNKNDEFTKYVKQRPKG